MDSMQVSGAWDAGSIPAGATILILIRQISFLKLFQSAILSAP